MKTLICLENIIGLSKTDCPCYEDDKPEDFDISKSGLFLDELDGLELKAIESDIECGDGSIWEKMETAVANAKIKWRTDFMKCIGDDTKARRKAFYGLIGLTEWTKSVVVSTDYLGERLRTCNIKGGEFTLKGIKTLMDNSATFTVEIYNNLSPTPIVSLANINAVADVITDNVLAPDPLLTFPLYSEECDELEYYILYKPEGAFAPRNNRASCSCSKRPEWEKWADIQGVSGDDIADRELWSSTKEANGLLLDLQFNCNTSELICGGTNSEIDFENDDKAMTMAYGIRYEAGRSLIDNILGSGNVNRYTMLPSDALWNLRNQWVERYEEMLAYFCQETEINSNDCLMCDDKTINKTSILS